MIAALRLALADLGARRTLVAGAIALIATPMAGFLLLHGFARGIDVEFAVEAGGDLIVQESNSVGEVTGSRIAATIETDLLARGATFAIPEIHSVAGSTAENAVLVRGIDLDRYRSITTFDLLAGRALGGGDGPDLVMVGTDLAAKRGVAAGDPILLRGRTHQVVGVFSVGTYADNEVWLSLDGARTLLGWDTPDVSVFVVPDDGAIHEGDVLPGPLSVARRGDFVDIADEWDPIFGLADFANLALAAASAIILAVILWRLAWLRRRELAVLRAIGLGRRVPFAYLAIEGAVVALLGLAGGIVGSRLLGAVVRIDAFGLTARAVFDGGGIVRAAVLTAAIMSFAVAVAGIRAVRTTPVEYLRGD